MLPTHLRSGRAAGAFRWPLAALALLAFAMAVLAACSSGGGEAAGGAFPIALTEQQVTRGAEVYAANCASCHGQPGGVPALPGAPSHGADGHTWHHADRQLFEWVLDRPPLAQVMPPFRGVLSEDDVVAVLAYMKSRWPEAIRDRQAELSAAYEAQIAGG